MSKLPVLESREVVRALEKAGFQVLRKSRGSHVQMAHPDGRRTTVPVHKGKVIGPGLMRKILRDVEMDVDELQDLV